MTSPGMRTPGGRSEDRGEFYGILVRGGKYIVHMRLPGPEGKKTWINMSDLESAQGLVEICSLYIDGFNALPRHHPDRNVHLFQKEAFEEFALQQLEADRNSHHELGIFQRIAMEDSTHGIDDGRIDECMMPTEAPVSSFATDEVGTNLQNSLPQDFGLPFDAELQAAGFRDSVAAVRTPEVPLSPPTHRQAGENQVICWSGPPEFMREKLREHELEEEKMQRRHNLERQRMRQRFRQDVLSCWRQHRKAPNQEAATQLGEREVLKACKCVRERDIATARVGFGKEKTEKEGCLYTGTQPTPENKELDTMEVIEGVDEWVDSLLLDT